MVERVRSDGGMLDVFHRQPRFVGYGIGTTQDEFSISISLWDSAEADAATEIADDRVAEHIEDRVELQDDFVGDLAFFETARPHGA